MGRIRRTRYPANTALRTELYTVEEPIARIQATLASVVNTFSPMSRGVQQLPMGDRGYAGRLTGLTGPLTAWTGAARPVAYPHGRTLGVGAGVSGASSLPTSTNVGVDSAIAWMSAGQIRAGL